VYSGMISDMISEVSGNGGQVPGLIKTGINRIKNIKLCYDLVCNNMLGKLLKMRRGFERAYKDTIDPIIQPGAT
jgi:hypothetical protein